MPTNQILTAVIVVAAMALIGRLLIAQQRKGKIDWPTIVGVLLLCGLFIGLFLGLDAYRVDLWREGTATADDCRHGGVIGRKAGDGATVVDKVSDNMADIFFAMNVSGVSHSGYWKLKQADSREDNTERSVEESQSGDGKVAIKRVVRNFDITKNPDEQSRSLYLPIEIATLASGQRILWTTTDYDAHEGVSPIGTLRPLEGKMADIAAADSTINQEVFFLSYDAGREKANTFTYVAMRAVIALAASAVLALLGYALKRFVFKKN